MKRRYHLLIIAVVGFLVYSNTFHVPFVFDGKGQIMNNPMIKNLNNFRLAMDGHHFRQSEGYIYVPSRLVGYLSFGINYYFGGLDVTNYHLTNLVIHIFNAVLVYFLVVLTFNTPLMRMAAAPRDPPTDGNKCRTVNLLALFTSLLFVSHPVQTEAVTYIVQRFASLATMFYLLSVLAYIKGRLTAHELSFFSQAVKPYRRKQGNEKADARRGVYSALLFFGISLLCAVLAMRTKEISFTLPIVVVIYELLFFSASFRKRLIFLAPVLMTLAIIPLAMIGVNKPISQILSDVTERARLGTNIPRADYLFTQMRVVTTYIRLIFFPVGQNVDYDYPIYHRISEPPVMISAVIILSLFVLAIYLLNRSRKAGENKDVGGDVRLCSRAALFRLAGFGIIWFFVTLSVTSSIIPIADVIFEHRIYLPSVGAFLAMAALGFDFLGGLKSSGGGRYKAAIALFGAIVIMFSTAAYSRNAVWKTAMSLWQDAAMKSPNKARPHNNLGETYYKKRRFDEAIREFQTALRLNPGFAVAHNNLGTAFAAKGLWVRAKKEFQIAVTLAPAYEDAHYNLGQACLLMGQTNQAVREFKTALRLNPHDREALRNLEFLTGKVQRTGP